MPDFQQFADRCANRDYFDAGDLVNVFKTAERHARLLQQIWEWARDERLEIAFPDDFAKSDGNMYGQAKAKAHVRSLLVGQQKAK